jgi:hypothetical protein
MSEELERKWVSLRASIFISDLVEDSLKNVRKSSEEHLTHCELIELYRILVSVRELRDQIEEGCLP